jgi:hypothetical protein
VLRQGVRARNGPTNKALAPIMLTVAIWVSLLITELNNFRPDINGDIVAIRMDYGDTLQALLYSSAARVPFKSTMYSSYMDACTRALDRIYLRNGNRYESEWRLI